MAQREKVIEELIQSKVTAVSKVEREQQANPNTQAATSRIENISGYPINLLDDEETRSLKNSYQNPAAYYLSGFIHESQGEASLAAPGYRLAIELRPQVNFFKTSIAKLDSNIANRSKKSFADTLIVIDTGYMPKIIPYQISQTFNIGGNSKLITLTFPVIEKSTERFRPSLIQLGDRVANPELVANIDAMARKNLRDEMPAYVLRASSRALVSLTAQFAADRAAQQAANQRNQNNQNNGTAALIGAIAGMITGYGLQAINVTDVRHWSTLPAQTYMARMGLPIGPTVLKYTLPSGVTASQTVNLVGGYNVVYIRMFRNRATVLTSNDPAALPPKVVAPTPVASSPIAAPVETSTAASSSILPPSQPSGSAMDGFKRLWGSLQDPKPEESAPELTDPATTKSTVSAPAQAQPSTPTPAPAPNPNPTSAPAPSETPASSNIEGVRPYEPPNLLNSFQQLFN